VALVVAGYLAYVALDRWTYDRQQTGRLLELAQSAAAPADAASLATEAPAAESRPRPLQNGALIGRLEIPGAGISAIVAAGTEELTLRRGVGHIDGTALPGESGNVGLAGHRDTVFRGLRGMRPADRIRLVTTDGSFEYAVESLQTVAPDRGDVLEPSTYPTLTLVTCYPFDFIGPAPLRFIVRAREVSRLAATPDLADLDRVAKSGTFRQP
jgi:sortase A